LPTAAFIPNDPLNIFQRMSNTSNFVFKACSVLGAFLFFGSSIIAQIYYFDNYSVKDGLAQSKVFTIVQDGNDHIWLGTEGGVSRFDGVKFENFTSEDGLALNGIRTLCEDSRGAIWMGHTGGGVTRYNGKKFERLDFMKMIFKSDVTAIAEDAEGNIWLTSASDGAIVFWNPSSEADSIKYEQFKGRQLSDRVFDLYIGRDSVMYFVTDVGVQKRASGASEFERFFVEGMGYFQITSLLEDSKGDFWFGTYNDGLYHYDVSEEELSFFHTRNGLAHNFVSTLSEDSRGAIWVGTWGGGLTRIKDGELKTFNTSNGLQDLKIWCIYEDIEGNILTGTNENGISIFKGERFTSFTQENGLVNDQVWAVLQDRSGKFWFGTNGGISIFNSGGKLLRHLTSEDYSIDDQIRYLKEDRSGNIWLGTYGNGTYEYVPGEDRFNFSFLINSYNTQLIVTAMEIDSDNQLWVGTTEGLIYYDIDRRQVQFLTQIYGIAGNDISALFADSKGVLWVGSRGKGIATIEGDSARQLSLDFDFTPTCFAEGMDGHIWIGTEGQGIYAIEGRKVVHHLSIQNGLLANLITLINVDEQNNVYIGTNQGLNKYVASEDKIYTYTEKDGFVGIETKNSASFRDTDGKLWFGTVGGVMVYDPLGERGKSIEPLTHIMRMHVNLEQREMTEGMKLGFQENSIIFDYKSICLANPDAVRYRFMLQGADIDWLPETEQTTATYPALPPGKYVFKVKARNSEGVWNEDSIDYAFQIKPPFYATWWFIISCVLLGAVGILSYIKIRTAKLRRENQVLEERVRERTATVVAQKEELAEKNKDITDSIQYAKRIQDAILPPDVPFQNTFILFKPKDIVSGDFYWLLEKEDKEFIAAVDCTGHGVPGAFMSIIGHNMLNKIVKEYGILKPSEIMQHLDLEVSNTLRQEGETVTVRDGMDMCLISYHKNNSLLEYSGAYNPIYLIRNGELIETKGNRFAIGRSETSHEKIFTNHEIKIKRGDTIYIFSDGYADQFGGESGKKFKTAPMKELLLNLQDKSMEEQHSILDSTIEAWRGDIEQIDDILIIGRRF
jgi:ligand-binding sensor domain-containing protein/serine phosphatase RsbU (regulator of sigma subunit)